MRHAIGIVAHNDRFDMAYRLSRQVNAQVISFDDGALGAYGNHLQVWRQLSETCSGAEWFVILEDDALPVPGFEHQLDEALAVAPSPVVSLYLGRTRPRDVQKKLREIIHAGVHTSWIQHDRMFHGVAIAVRADVVGDMQYTLTQSPYVLYSIDRAVGMWANDAGHRVSYSWPSLVDHADEGSVISIHPDGQPRGPLIATTTGIPVLARRVAWKVGSRAVWDATVTELSA